MRRGSWCRRSGSPARTAYSSATRSSGRSRAPSTPRFSPTSTRRTTSGSAARCAGRRPDHGYGELSDQFIWDRATRRWEWRADGKYDQLFPDGYTLHAQLQDLSDVNFFQEFGGTSLQSLNRTLLSYFNLARTWGPQAFTFRSDYNQTFYTDPTSGITSEVTLDRLGEVEYRLRSTRIGSTALYVAGDGVADEFQVDKSATLRGRYGRIDLFPTLSLLTPGLAWLNITPTIGARETYYTAQYSSDDSHFVDDPVSRHYGTAVVDIVGPSFSRVWTEETATS